VHSGGLVTVSGTVPSYEHKLAVSQCVRGAAGCTAVDIQLNVRCFHYEGSNYTLLSADGRYLMPGLAPASPARLQPIEVVTMPSRPRPRPRPVENLAVAAKAAIPGPGSLENLAQAAKAAVPGPGGREPIQTRPGSLENLAQAAKAAIPGPAGREPIKMEVPQPVPAWPVGAVDPAPKSIEALVSRKMWQRTFVSSSNCFT